MSPAVAEPVAPAAAIPSAPAATPPASAGAPAATAPASVPGGATPGAPAAQPTSILSEPAKAADPAKSDAAAKPAEAAWELKAPEGAPLSADEVKAAEKFAKDNGLSQAQAEKILARDIDSRTAIKTARETEAKGASEAWLKETLADPDIGGAKLPQTQANIRKALAAVYSPEERAIIEASPFLNNRLYAKALNAIGSRFAEDSMPAGSPMSGDAATMHPAHILYGKK